MYRNKFALITLLLVLIPICGFASPPPYTCELDSTIDNTKCSGYASNTCTSMSNPLPDSCTGLPCPNSDAFNRGLFTSRGSSLQGMLKCAKEAAAGAKELGKLISPLCLLDLPACKGDEATASGCGDGVCTSIQWASFPGPDSTTSGAISSIKCSKSNGSEGEDSGSYTVSGGCYKMCNLVKPTCKSPN